MNMDVGTLVRISRVVSLRASDAPQGTGVVTERDGDRRRVRWSGGTQSWHGEWLLVTVPPLSPPVAPEKPSQEDHIRALADLMNTLGETVVKLAAAMVDAVSKESA